MGAEFLSLGLADQRDAYTVGAANLGRNETSLEKDVWVCWVLDALFRCPDLPAMAFKGGTSLSKAYAAISRFSEDVDITMNGSDLIPGFDPFQEAVSRKSGTSTARSSRLQSRRCPSGRCFRIYRRG